MPQERNNTLIHTLEIAALNSIKELLREKIELKAAIRTGVPPTLIQDVDGVRKARVTFLILQQQNDRLLYNVTEAIKKNPGVSPNRIYDAFIIEAAADVISADRKMELMKLFGQVSA